MKQAKARFFSLLIVLSLFSLLGVKQVFASSNKNVVIQSGDPAPGTNGAVEIKKIIA